MSSGEHHGGDRGDERPLEALTVENGVARLNIDLRVYRLSAAQKAAYRLATRCTVAFGSIHDDHVDVELRLVSSGGLDASREIVRNFYQELLDQELREKVREETAHLRTLLLAIAFSRTGLSGRD